MGVFYYVNGTTAATAATDQHVIAEIWNPSSTRTISLLELALVSFAAPGAGAGFITRRSSAKGTAGSTVTPVAANHARNQAAPDSGFTLELAAFTGQPTLVTGDLSPAWVFAAVAASGVVLPIPRGIEIPPGTGLCFCNRAAIAFPTSEIAIVVEEL